MAADAGSALVRVPGERRRYEIRGIGTLRLEGWTSRRATAQSAAEGWALSRSGWRRQAQATASGLVVGTFVQVVLSFAKDANAAVGAGAV